LVTVKTICENSVTFADGRSLVSNGEKLHLDQGIAVTSHASQGKTVDNVIVSAPVEAFSQVNSAQFYVSMSRARQSMHLFTDSKAALKEAVAKPSQRVGALELIHEANPVETFPQGKATKAVPERIPELKKQSRDQYGKRWNVIQKALKHVRMPQMPFAMRSQARRQPREQAMER
jgi:hypothetical protein